MPKKKTASRRWCPLSRCIEMRTMPNSTRILCIPWFLLGVDMPHDIIGEPVNAVAGSFSHFREAFCFGLVLKGVAWEVDA